MKALVIIVLLAIAGSVTWFVLSPAHGPKQDADPVKSFHAFEESFLKNLQQGFDSRKDIPAEIDGKDYTMTVKSDHFATGEDVRKTDSLTQPYNATLSVYMHVVLSTPEGVYARFDCTVPLTFDYHAESGWSLDLNNVQAQIANHAGETVRSPDFVFFGPGGRIIKDTLFASGSKAMFQPFMSGASK
jgi:hypothetical protein